MNECEVCGRPNAEYHHVVFRSQGGLTFKYNRKYLCTEHHKGNNGPHRNRKVDLQYKVEMQDKLDKALDKEYYTPEELINILQLNKNQVKNITKTLIIHKEGYDKWDIIRRLMGGKLYDTDNSREANGETKTESA